MGLLHIVEGAYEVISGKSIPKPLINEEPSEKMFDDHIMSIEDITYGYCTEFIILTEEGQLSLEEKLKENLASIGDSVIVVGDEDKIKVHVHTDNPDQALNWALEIGPLTRIKIDNMREQVTNKVNHQVKVEEKQYGFISVASGDGLETLFKDLGVDEVIQGGQTMNPSTQDFINRIELIHAKQIFIFPNNSNILLAANQAKEISNKEIIVIPSKSIPQGITSLLSFNSDIDLIENQVNMTRAIEEVKTGQVTYAVRDTTFNSIKIKKEDIIGIFDGDIKCVGNDVYQVSKELIDYMVDEDSSLISIYYGADVEKNEIDEFIQNIEEQYSELDVEINYGGQALYYMIISVE